MSWQVVDQQLARDDDGEPYLELVAERDFGELEHIPDHELEHTLARLDEEELPAGAVETITRAEAAGLSIELVALAPGEEPDWDEAERYTDAPILEELEDDLIELCGVHPDRDPPETWLATITTASSKTCVSSAPRSRATTTRSRNGNSEADASSRPSAAPTKASPGQRPWLDVPARRQRGADRGGLPTRTEGHARPAGAVSATLGRDGAGRRDDDPASPRSAAVEPVALVGRRWTRDHVDPGRLRGDARRRDREHAHRLRPLSPTLFGVLIESASRSNVNIGYLLGAGLMITAGVIAIFLAVPAERRALEDVASPYTAVRGRGPSAIAAPASAS